MCGGGGGNDNDDGLDYRKEQDRIEENRRRRGQAMVDSLFDGGTYATGRADSFNPDQTYYNAQGERIYKGGSLGSEPKKYTSRSGFHQRRELKDSYKEWRDRKDELEEKANTHGLYTGRESNDGYGDEFFEQRSDAYLDYANPRIDEQREEAADELAFGLARSGLGQSSVAANRQAEMEDTYESAREGAAREAQNQADQARKQVAEQRSRLRSLVDDPQALSSEIPGVADALNALNQPDQSPVGPVFQGLTAGLGAGVSAQKTAEARKRIIDKYGGSSPSETSPHG